MDKFYDVLLKKRYLSQNSQLVILPQDKVKQFLDLLGNDWIINANGRLFKEYKFANFLEAINFANKIALIAEEEQHHPDLYISWGSCSVEIWTHTRNGLTENDFLLAYKITQLIQ